MAARLYGLLDALEQNPRIEVVDLGTDTSRYEPEELDIEDYWRTINRLAGITLDPRLRDCYIGNRVRATWRARSSSYEDPTSGELILLDLNREDVWRPVGHRARYNLGATIGGCYAGGSLMQSLELGSPNPRVWTDDWDSKPRRMVVDYPAYLELTLLTRGVQPWPLLFCEDAPTLLLDPAVAAAIEQMLAELPLLFPGVDFQVLTSRYDDVRRLAASR